MITFHPEALIAYRSSEVHWPSRIMTAVTYHVQVCNRTNLNSTISCLWMSLAVHKMENDNLMDLVESGMNDTMQCIKTLHIYMFMKMLSTVHL